MALNDVSTLPVLLVDDEPQLLHSVSVVLRSSGMTQILTQSDSREALPMLAAHEVGVLVLDLTMPHLPGSVLLERIGPDYPGRPVAGGAGPARRLPHPPACALLEPPAAEPPPAAVRVMTATNALETPVQCMQAGAV